MDPARTPFIGMASKAVDWNLALLCAAATGVTLYATSTVGIWSSLFFLLAAFPMTYCAQRQAVHKPQTYKVSHLALWVFLSVSVLMILAMCFRFDGTLIPMLLFGAGGSDIDDFGRSAVEKN